MTTLHTVNAYDAKTHFSQLLQAVESGESFVINRHGKPVARLVSAGVSAPRAEDMTALLGEFRVLRNQLHNQAHGPMDLRAMVEEGRRN